MKQLNQLLKQAQQMQSQLAAAQEDLAKQELDFSQAGGAIKIKINGQGDFKAITIDPEFLKEDASMVNETLLNAIIEAQQQVKSLSQEKMSGLTGGLNLPGFPGF
jgi:DNA-binding YbaB/EbfC family protein